MPSHYLRQFHIKYNPDAEKNAKAAGFESWHAYFKERNKFTIGLPRNPDLPTLSAYKLKAKTSEYFIYERNPYFWKIDTAGNQLPYIDGFRVTTLQNVEMYNAKIISGETDYAMVLTNIQNYSLYQTSAEQGNYRVLPWKMGYSSILNYKPNQTDKDPVLREIFRDVRFRRALSLAINRDEINETVCFGVGEPAQFTCLPFSDYYEEKFAKSYAEYDPNRANALLDEMDLEWDKNHEYRLRSDGKTLEWVLEYAGWAAWGMATSINELVTEYWKDVGCKLICKEVGRQSVDNRIRGNEVSMSCHWGDCASNALIFNPSHFLPNTERIIPWGPAWHYWVVTDGKEGEEPPEEVKKNMDRWVSGVSWMIKREFDWAKRLWPLRQSIFGK